MSKRLLYTLVKMLWTWTLKPICQQVAIKILCHDCLQVHITLTHMISTLYGCGPFSIAFVCINFCEVARSQYSLTNFHDNLICINPSIQFMFDKETNDLIRFWTFCCPKILMALYIVSLQRQTLPSPPQPQDGCS